MGEQEKKSEQNEEYQGRPGQTQMGTIHYSCGECGLFFCAQCYTSINVATDPELGELLSKGELNTLSCPSCSTMGFPDLQLHYHDPKARCFALLLPEGLRHQELQARARLLDALAAEDASIPEYVRRAEVVFGTAGLLQLLDETIRALSPETQNDVQAKAKKELEEKKTALDLREEKLLAGEEDLQAKQEDLLSQKANLERSQKELSQGWAELERERAILQLLSLDLQKREKTSPEKKVTKGNKVFEQEKKTQDVQKVGKRAKSTEPGREPTAQPLKLEGRPKQDVDRWRASDDRSTAFAHEGQLYFLHRPGTELLPILIEQEPELRIQLHDLPSSPLITAVVVPNDPEPENLASKALFWYFDPNHDEHSKILDQLAEECFLHLDLYDDESRLVKLWDIQAPLSENVQLLIKRAQELTEARDEKPDFKAAVAAYDKLGEERLGKKQHNFSADSFQELATPAAARLALGIISYWSEEENTDYLIQIKSFPMTYWRAIRERVVGQALEFGLNLNPQLIDFALRQKLAPTRKELLTSLVSSFAKVSLRIKPSDLDPHQEMENWKRILAECRKEGIEIDPKIEQLATAAAKRSGVVVDETKPGGDLTLLSNADLLRLLGDRSQAKDAALELCERGDSKMAEEVYRALCSMTRIEVARVVPSMLQLGAEVIPLFIKGLKHRKSFIRQGCALALGTRRTEAAISPLIEMLLGEPTLIWKEASRALGDMGPLALPALVASIPSADREGRERIAWSLAQTAIDEACHSEVQAMTKARDTRLARVARRALDLVKQVRDADQEVRGAKPLTNQTIVRSFARKFYDSMAADISELGEDDILEQEEVLDESDILEEEVEISDEDIINSN